MQLLAKLVSKHMGGAGSEEDLQRRWQRFNRGLKARTNSVLVPIGAHRVGVSTHRALLFKTLADALGIRCQVCGSSRLGAANSCRMSLILAAELW